MILSELHVHVLKAWSVSLNPQGDYYASTGSDGTVKINTADPSNFGETVETLAPRTDGRNKFGMHVAYVCGLRVV